MCSAQARSSAQAMKSEGPAQAFGAVGGVDVGSVEAFGSRRRHLRSGPATMSARPSRATTQPNPMVPISSPRVKETASPPNPMVPMGLRMRSPPPMRFATRVDVIWGQSDGELRLIWDRSAQDPR